MPHWLNGNAPLGRKIGFDPRPLRDPVVQGNQSRNFLLEALHPLGKSVTQALDDLEDREIDVSQPAPDQILAAVLLQHALEIA
jgi:hypothetical protein